MRKTNAAIVARAGYLALKRKKGVIVPGPMYNLVALLPRFLPRSLVTRIVGSIA